MAGPFLSYLTVFKSRLGVANLVLGLSGDAHQPDTALLRKLHRILDETKDLRLDEPENSLVFQYLTEKRLISRESRLKGRYSGYAALEPAGNGWKALDQDGEPVSSVKVYITDIWLSNPAIPSTIGVPTPDNVRETFELPFQLALLSKSTNTWTASGQLVNRLRVRFTHLISDPTNPLLLCVESVGLLRQIIAVDGLLLTELVRTLLASRPGLFSRDDVAAVFAEIVERAIKAAKGLSLPPPLLREGVDFLRQVQATEATRIRKQSKGLNASRAPGLLEHRVSPRLEWLTELGYLSKDGLAKNGFQYRTTDALQGLLTDLEWWSGSDSRAEEVAIRQWVSNPAWRHFRGAVATETWPNSVYVAYQMMRRRIGPAPLREVAFIVSVITAGDRTYQANVEDLIQFARNTNGATLSGGRYQGNPENIFLTDQALSRA